MLSLIYVSSALREFSDDDLLALLEQSREKNARLDITGMLLYKDGNFIQVLEGPDDAVHQIFETIRGDSRHHGVIRLLERPIETRDFPDWQMGFRKLGKQDLPDIPGYTEFMDEPLNSEQFRTNAGHARRLLDIFRRNMNLR